MNDRSALLAGIGLVAVALVTVAAIAIGPTSNRVEMVTPDVGENPGLNRPRATVDETTADAGDPFVLAGPEGQPGLTTIAGPPPTFFVGPTTPTLPPTSTSTSTSTTTTIPGSDSLDPVCRATAALYAVSRAIPSALTSAGIPQAVAPFVAALDSLRGAVVTTSAPDVTQHRDGIVSFIRSLSSAVGSAADEEALGRAYARLADPRDPAVAAFLGHLHSTCTELGLIIERPG